MIYTMEGPEFTMFRSKAILVAGLMIAVALAGCASGDSGDDGINLDDDTGDSGTTLQVLVTDDTLTPLAGATVQVRDTGAQKLTDSEGVAKFSLNESGAYTVDAQKLGFASQSKRVDVAADQTANLDFALDPIQVVEAYHETLIYDGFMACGGGLVLIALTTGCNDANHRVFFDTNVTTDIQTIIGEMVWQQTSSFSAEQLRMTMGINEDCSEFCEYEEQYGDEQGPSPIYLREDASFAGITENEEEDLIPVRQRAWTPFSSDGAVPVILVVQQPFQLHTTVFYGEEAQDGFSALPDA